MRVAVTGGSGVVGGAVVRHLVADGFEVSALARTDLAAMALRKLGATPIAGDLTEPGSLDALVEGASRVFNVAGVNELCSRDLARMWQVNVEGALSILEACERAGVQTLVHTSSAVAIGAPGGVVANEHIPHRGHFISEYERSKTVAERLLLDRTGSVGVVSVNPSSVQGPGRATGTGRLLLSAVNGNARVAVDAVFSLVDIDDCARGHLRAAEVGVPGERYILSGQTTSVRDLLGVLAQILQRPIHPYYLSSSALTALAPLLGIIVRVLPPDIGLCRASLAVLTEGHRYDGGRAARELGLDYTPLRSTLERLVAWASESS